MVAYILFLPLITASLFGVFNKSFPKIFVKIFSIAFMLIASILSVYTFLSICESDKVIDIFLYEWIKINSIKINLSIYVDRLTSIMFCIVTIISSIVHIYSISYMEEDKNINKFLSYLSLFTFFMLLLVCSNNLLQLFIGWEGVGLCSYLLIGYWYEKRSANDAAIKAFIVNRVGDFAFIIALLLLFFYTKSLDFREIFSSIDDLKIICIDFFGIKFEVINLICLLLFIGSMGKSAQLGLHVWLPDAMEGPTPVSALIHAATMVTAGIFLIVRMSLLFEQAIYIRDFIIIIGSLTSVIMAAIAVTNNDIKKIIAYSTCSQLGYMFIACGSSNYNLAIFHLTTHAFFKALLFLCAGNIIHMTHEQSLDKLGGLFSKMKITFIMFILGSLALVGIYPFAGYYSKDLIIESLISNNNSIYQFGYISSLIGVFLTALYSSKLIVKVFFGKYTPSGIKEAPAIMLMPMLVLAFGSVLAGIYGVYILDIGDDFFSNSMVVLNRLNLHDGFIQELYPLIIGVLGLTLGYVIYNTDFFNTALTTNIFYKIFVNKLYFDEIYTFIFVGPTRFFAILSNDIDNNLIDNQGPRRSRKIIKSLSLILSKLQNGYLYFYYTIAMLGVVFGLSWIIIKG
jgi:NADH-quinone oxidoreductase subunit L